ncbi:hypothetical protein LQW54_000355 [Pestalotiopsis sp. IQ-011]
MKVEVKERRTYQGVKGNTGHNKGANSPRSSNFLDEIEGAYKESEDENQSEDGFEDDLRKTSRMKKVTNEREGAGARAST